MPTLHIFVIHAQHLKVRAMHIHGVTQNIRLAAIAEKYDVNIRLILSPEASNIETKTEEYQQLTNYEPVNNPAFDNFRVLLSPEMLSNSLKHLQVWKRISEMPNLHSDDLFLVMEDDTFPSPDISDTFRVLLRTMKANQDAWDITMLGLTTNENSNPNLMLRELSAITNVLPCKESYFIKPNIAKRCLQDWQKHKFIMRIQWSYWLSQNPDVKVRVPSKRIFLDSSKLGIMPSSIHANNMLIFNREFVELAKMTTLPPQDISGKLKLAEQLYASVAHMNSPDIMNIFGSILFKCGKLQEAKQQFMNAINVMKMHHCKINPSGDLYQNLVNIHEKLQDDIKQITKMPSHYDQEEMAKSDT